MEGLRKVLWPFLTSREQVALEAKACLVGFLAIYFPYFLFFLYEIFWVQKPISDAFYGNILGLIIIFTLLILSYFLRSRALVAVLLISAIIDLVSQSRSGKLLSRGNRM